MIPIYTWGDQAIHLRNNKGVEQLNRLCSHFERVFLHYTANKNDKISAFIFKT